MRAARIFIVGPDDADIAAVDHRARLVFPLKRPRGAEQVGLLLAFLVGIGAVLCDPCLALGQAIRRQRRIGLDLGVEDDAGLDPFGLEGKVRLGLGGEDDRAKQDSSKNNCASHVALFGGKTLK